jgi:hypothetical protein
MNRPLELEMQLITVHNCVTGKPGASAMRLLTQAAVTPPEAVENGE